MESFNLKCAKHKQSNMLFICLNQKCSDNRKCCVYCVDEQHQKHEIVSIEKFIQEINQNLQINNNNPQKQEIYKYLNKLQVNFNQLIQQTLSSINLALSKCQKKINDHFNVIYELMSVTKQMTVRNHILVTLSETNQTINQYLSLAEKSKNVKIGTLMQTMSISNVYYQMIESQLTRMENDTTQKINQIEQYLDNVKFVGKRYEQDLYFSDKNKAMMIQLSDSRKQICGMIGNSVYSMCCLDKPLDPLNHRFFVRINANPSKKLWLGVCILDIVRNKNFIACNGLGKGVYGIDQSGGGCNHYSNPNNHAVALNHHIKSYNFSANTVNNSIIVYIYYYNGQEWNFKQGDIVMVYVSYQQKTVGFYVINQNNDPDDELAQVYQNQFQMPIVFDQGQIYPFVGLNGTAGDQVTILSRSQVDELMDTYHIAQNLLQSEVQSSSSEDQPQQNDSDNDN